MKSSYIPALDGIRAIAIMFVFFAHAGLGSIVPAGFGVTIFFFLSGYLITTLLWRESKEVDTISLSKFYLRRAFRILPPMYVTLAFAWCLATWSSLAQRGNLLGFASATVYLQNYAELLHSNARLPAGMSVLWSLAVEEHFYLIFPLVYSNFVRRGSSKRTQTRTLLGLCGAALIWRCCLVFALRTPLTVFPRWTYNASDTRFDAILFGCILAICNNPLDGESSPLLKRFKGVLASGGLLLIVVSYLIRDPHFRETIRYTLLSIALYPIFFYCVSSFGQWQVSWLEWKPLRRLGWVSYSVYLVHDVYLHWGAQEFPRNPICVAIASGCASILYGWLMRIAVEEPSRRFRVGLESAHALRTRAVSSLAG